MFVTVRYGEDQEQIFNPDCRNDVLLSCIKKNCQCQEAEIVELSDERGVIKNLRRYPQDYAKEHLKDREILVLLRVEQLVNTTLSPEDSSSTSDRIMFTPLLTSLANNSDFTDMLNPSKDDDTLSEISTKSSRRRSSTFEIEEFRNMRSKSKINHSGKKPTSRKGQRAHHRKGN